MQLPELEALRLELKISRAQVCRLANINTSTYDRWLRYIRGEPGGNCPQRNKLRQVRVVLEHEHRLRQPS